MTGMPGRAATEADTRPYAPQARAPFGSSTSVGRLAELSARELGWTGTVLHPTRLLGRYVVPVAELIPEAHAERLCLGSGPVQDRTEVATWVWPELEGRVPPAAVRLTGVLAPARHWRSALTAGAPFARYAGTAMVVSKSVALEPNFMETCLFRARQAGVAVLSADGDTVSTELAGRCWVDEPPMEHTAMSRWINEVLYDQLLRLPAPAEP